jgi:hypothetical protein
MPKNPHPPRGASGGKKPAATQSSTSEPASASGQSKKGKSTAKSNETEKPAAKNVNSKTQKAKSNPGVTNTAETTAEAPPKRPDTRTLIGGAS